MSSPPILSATDIRLLRDHLARSRRVLQPVADARGDLRWAETTAATTLPAAAQLPLFSPKALLFSERESLFVFDGHRFRETPPAVQPTVLFGVSACDLAAIHYQDRFFADDPWYQTRRQALLLVGIDCTSPCAGGFCPLTDSGPFVREGHADLVLQQDDGHWLLFVTSPAGARALDGLAVAASDDRPQAVRTGEPPVIARFPDDRRLRAGIAAINDRQVTTPRWDRLGTECITCTGCSTVCPTCSCYATRQEPVPAAAGHATGHDSDADATTTPVGTVRFWDSCLYEGFQREASGHNPTVAAGKRIERFWTHKFGDAFVARFGHYTCVGCGRCDRTCPAGIGARHVLSRLGGHEDAPVAGGCP